MTSLEQEIRDLVDSGVMPITFEEVVRAPSARRSRRSPLLVGLACAGCIVVLALGVAWVRDAVRSTDTPRRPGAGPTAAASDDVYVQPSESMAPTLAVNARYRINRTAFASREPARADVVALSAPPGSNVPESAGPMAKRIIGLPGETIEGRDGHVYVNSVLLNERSYLGADVQSKTFGPVAIPADHYFVLGDNRQYSNDSTVYGPVPRDVILGQVVALP